MRKTQRMLTQDEIIYELVRETARQLVSDYRYSHPIIYIPSKNLPTLAKMVKRGYVQFVDRTDYEITFSARGLAAYDTEIRLAAIQHIEDENGYDLRSSAADREQFANESYLRFCTRSISKRYWSNTPNFWFLEFTFINALDKSVEINFNYDHGCTVNTESRLQWSDMLYSRAEIGTLPMVALSAIGAK
jgi:hypothetical protein